MSDTLGKIVKDPRLQAHIETVARAGLSLMEHSGDLASDGPDKVARAMERIASLELAQNASRSENEASGYAKLLYWAKEELAALIEREKLIKQSEDIRARRAFIAKIGYLALELAPIAASVAMK